MELDEAVSIIKEVLMDNTLNSIRSRAWDVILNNLPTAPNTGSPKCLCETCQNAYCEGLAPTVNVHAKYTVYECDGFTKSLRASA